MAIPVANPPPNDPPSSSGGGPYAPPPDGGGYGDPPPRGPIGGGMSPVVRGCLIAGAFGVFLACIGGSVLVYSCMGVVSLGTTQAVRNVADGYRSAAIRAGEESTYDADLRQLVVLQDEGHLAFLTFGILSNRFEDARRDGIIDTDDLHHGMELIHDIVIGNGTVNIEQYPEAR
jgi:hypothetical protein